MRKATVQGTSAIISRNGYLSKNGRSTEHSTEKSRKVRTSSRACCLAKAFHFSFAIGSSVKIKTPHTVCIRNPRERRALGFALPCLLSSIAKNTMADCGNSQSLARILCVRAGDFLAAKRDRTGFGECYRRVSPHSDGRRRLAMANPTERGRDFLIFVSKTFHKVPFSINREENVIIGESNVARLGDGSAMRWHKIYAKVRILGRQNCDAHLNIFKL